MVNSPRKKLIQRLAVPTVLFVCAMPAPLFAQTADVSGRIVDTSNSVVPGATVTAVRPDTGVVRSGVSNTDGFYSIPALPPGTYTVTVRLDGFAPEVREGLLLANEQAARIDFVLKPGTVEEQVQVTASTVLETGPQTSATSHPAKHPRAAAQRARPHRPGHADARRGDGRQLRQRRRHATSAATSSKPTSASAAAATAVRTCCSTACPTPRAIDRSSLYIPPVDATQEFKVDINGFSAEYGRTTGGILSIVSRSGTNSSSGTAYEFYRNSRFDSKDFFTKLRNLSRPNFSRASGGRRGRRTDPARPHVLLRRYEGLRQDVPLTVLSTVPTLAQRNGDFSQTFDAQGRLIVIYDPLTTARQANGQVVRQAVRQQPHPAWIG